MRVQRAPVAITTCVLPELENIVGGQAVAAVQVDVGEPLAAARGASRARGPRLASPGSARLEAQAAADVVGGLGERHLVAAARRGSARIRDRPGPPPTMSTEAALPARAKRSGCQPRRHSSPMVGFCVQRTGTLSCQLEMQMLQPMHSRMSCSRPSSILLRQERVGDRRARAADQVEHAAPDLRRPWCPGEVKRPTPTTGLRGDLLDELDDRLVAALGGEARRRAVGRARSPSSRPTDPARSASSSTTSCASDGRALARARRAAPRG